PFFFACAAAPGALHSFPTRRSSDLGRAGRRARPVMRTSMRAASWLTGAVLAAALAVCAPARAREVVRQSDSRIKAQVEEALKARSEEHTSELQSRFDLVCRLLLEKK